MVHKSWIMMTCFCYEAMRNCKPGKKSEVPRFAGSTPVTSACKPAECRFALAAVICALACIAFTVAVVVKFVNDDSSGSNVTGSNAGNTSNTTTEAVAVLKMAYSGR